jgi:hypothetical protein
VPSDRPGAGHKVFIVDAEGSFKPHGSKTTAPEQAQASPLQEQQYDFPGI